MNAQILSLLFALGTPFILEYLKDQPWAPFIQRNTPLLNRITGVVAAAANVVGVQFLWDAAAGSLTVTGLNLVGIATLGATAFLAGLLQEIVYRTAVK